MVWRWWRRHCPVRPASARTSCGPRSPRCTTSPLGERHRWGQVLALYDLLDAVAPNPVASLNRTVAVAGVHGPSAGLALLDSLVDDARIAGHHRAHAVRAFLLGRAGHLEQARAAYVVAAGGATSEVERRHLQSGAARLP